MRYIGGKSKIATELAKQVRLRTNAATIFEPFMGGAAMTAHQPTSGGVVSVGVQVEGGVAHTRRVSVFWGFPQTDFAWPDFDRSNGAQRKRAAPKSGPSQF